MHKSTAREFRHPTTGEALNLQVHLERDNEVVFGALVGGGDRFEIRQGIPRFVSENNYADSFAYQWRIFPTAQLDSNGGWRSQSEDRLFEETKWPKRLEGQRILEAGSGMGRFTEILAQTGAQIYTFDYSGAIEMNERNNGHFENVCFAQADVYHPPYRLESFDKVLCIGVLQHCPSPRKAFLSLTRFLKPGGQIVVDVYRLNWRKLLLPKYYLRPITRLIPPHTLLRWVRLQVSWTHPLIRWVHRLGFNRLGRVISSALGVIDYRGLIEVSDTKARELSVLETLDSLSPFYDRPQTLGEVRRWFSQAGLVNIEVTPGYNGIEARGTKPIRT